MSRSNNFRGNNRNNGQARTNFTRQHSNLNRSNADNNDFTSMFNAIMERLETLEKRDSSRGRQPSRVRFYQSDTASTRTRSSSFSTNHDNYVESANPDFRFLIQEAFKYAQTAHHIQNWANCPRSIAKRVDDIIEDINPPQGSSSLKLKLKELGNNFKTSVVAVINQHLLDTHSATKQRFQLLDKRDVHLSRPIVERQLERRLGKKLQRSATKTALDDLLTPTTDHHTAQAWQQALRNTRSRHEVNNQVPVPVPLSNRFEPLRLEQTGYNNNGTITGATTSTTLPKTGDKRPRPTEYSSDSDNIPDTDMEHEVNDTFIKLHRPDQKPWSLQIKPNISCLAITDSNAATWLKTDLPTGFQVEGFRGGRIHDAVELLEQASSDLTNIKNVAVLMGLNDRNTQDPSSILTDLERLADWGFHNNKHLIFIELPVLSSLSTTCQNNIQHINQAAKDIFGDKFININQTAVRPIPNDKTGTHYTLTTAKHLVSVMYNYFLC